MKTFLCGAALALAALFTTSCEDGGSGPHPMHEFDIIAVSNDTAVDGSVFKWDAMMTVSGDSLRMITLPGLSNEVDLTNGISYGYFVGQFDSFTQRIDTVFVPVYSLRVASWPSDPGTIDVTPTTLAGITPTFQNGFTVNVGGVEYFPVSGKIVVTKVIKEGVLPVYIEGYANGVMRSQFPRDPITTPPDPSRAPLFGETITLHAMKFRAGSIPTPR